MLAFKLFLALTEGLVFAVLALGVYVAFQWLRFPDLTPDGSFALGATVYVKSSAIGVPPWTALLLAMAAGAVAGLFTAAVNRVAKIPPVVAGLLVASSLYSLNWLLLGKPNQYLEPSGTIVGDVGARVGVSWLFVWLSAIIVLLVTCLSLFSNSVWGLRFRAIGENPLLARDLGVSEVFHTFLGLFLANSLVGLAGALFAQRSFSADVNMGVGVTITGLTCMILGLLMANKRTRLLVILSCVCLGSVVYKIMTLVALEMGMPAESFRLLSAVILVITFVALSFAPTNFLRDLKWR